MSVIYCYTNETGETIERPFAMGRAPRGVTVAGVRFDRDIPAEHAGEAPNAGKWPKLCDATGVLHSQVDEAETHLNSVGVPTTFTRDGTGRCILRDNQHRNNVLQALGMHDRDACYRQRARP